MPIIFVGDFLDVALIMGTEKVWIRGRGGEYQDIPWKKFCFTYPKKFIGEPFSVSQIPGIEKFFA